MVLSKSPQRKLLQFFHADVKGVRQPPMFRLVTVPWSTQNSLGHNSCTQTHMSPDGLKYSDSLLPHAVNYSNPKGAVVQAWRCVRWFTNQCLVDSIDKENQTLMFDSTIGCNQGGEGCVRFQVCCNSGLCARNLCVDPLLAGLVDRECDGRIG